MRSICAPTLAPSTQIQRGNLPATEENFRCDFGIVARGLWPGKTAAKLASIAGKTERAAQDWLNGRAEPPGCIIALIVKRCVRPASGPE